MISRLPLLVSLGLLTALGLSGCSGHPVERKLTGRWLGQDVENLNDESLAAATGWARGTSFEFASSTLTVSIPAEDPRSGKYQVVAVRDKTVDLSVERSNGKSDRLRLQLDDEHSMRWMLDGGRAVVMRREQ